MKKSRLNRISAKNVQELLDQGKSIPASSFDVARRLGKKKRPKIRSLKTWYKDIQHGSKTQLLVYQNFELIQRAGDISNLEAEKDFILNAEGGGQVGAHRVDIIFFDKRGFWQVYNVKADYQGSIDALSIWKMRHLLKQYPTMPHPETDHPMTVKYDFFIADEYGSRVFRNERELRENI